MYGTVVVGGSGQYGPGQGQMMGGQIGALGGFQPNAAAGMG